MFSSPFEESPSKKATVTIPQDCDIIFVSDYFVSDLIGGAELTSEALIDASPFNVFKLHARHVTVELLEQGQSKHWIFTNYASMNLQLIPSVVANLNYSVIEYDFKYCKYRSPEKHAVLGEEPCDCHEDIHGKMISTLMYGAKSIWWMSEAQMDRYHRLFPFLAERDNVVLSSVFNDRFFAAIKFLKEQSEEVARTGWLVLGSDSWVKGTQDAINYCKENKLEFEVISGLENEEVLQKFSMSEGFVYLPTGADTCPRMVIEAKLLGCKLHINDNVQHANEIWFDTDDSYDTEAYLYGARERFWNGIKHAMSYQATLSGYTTTLNAIDNQYPWKQSIESMLGFCNQVVVVDGGSTDGTLEELQAWAKTDDRLIVELVERDWSHPRFAVFDGMQKAAARSLCTMQYCWQQDADEVVHENDYEKITRLLTVFPSEVDIVSLPVVEYWGSSKKVRLDVNPWKWRVSRNKPNITHGIPAQFRQTDGDGHLYASPGTDGCDYIDNETYVPMPHASFYSHQAHDARIAALTGNEEAQLAYRTWVENNLRMLPSTYHYSWFDLERKIRTYRDYWSQHWQSLYNIPQEDTAENNMFFDKAWCDVTDEDITQLALELGEKMGGWVFHNKVDFSKPTPHLGLELTGPAIMKNNESK